MNEKGDGNIDPLPHFIGQPAGRDHDSHHGQAENAVHHPNLADGQAGDILHIDREKTNRHIEENIPDAIRDQDPGEEAARQDQTEHGAQVGLQAGQGERFWRGGFGFGGFACHAHPHDGGDDVQHRSNRDHAFEIQGFHQETAQPAGRSR